MKILFNIKCLKPKNTERYNLKSKNQKNKEVLFKQKDIIIM